MDNLLKWPIPTDGDIWKGLKSEKKGLSFAIYRSYGRTAVVCANRRDTISPEVQKNISICIMAIPARKSLWDKAIY
jgi:hypothetical protein